MTILNPIQKTIRNMPTCPLLNYRLQVVTLMIWFVIGIDGVGNLQAQPVGFQQTIAKIQPKMVKINGSGGFQGLEPYQSGFLISPDGLILTVWSYVLDNDVVTVTLNDGQRFDAKLIGYDPSIEIAVLKIESEGLPCFRLEESATAKMGDRILAFSNLYGVASGNESTSVQQGIISVKTTLSARRGAVNSVYQGPVYLVDAVTNNPGAAGGAITNRQGRLVGLIGKELRDQETTTWLNFAIDIQELIPSVNDILSGKMILRVEPSKRRPTEPMTLGLIGIALVPDIVKRTPPYIDRVVSGSIARETGLLPDDLIIDINGQLTPSIRDVVELLASIDRDASIRMTVQRGNQFRGFEIRLQK